MALWVVLTVMCAAAAMFVASPFLRQTDSNELDRYRNELHQIETKLSAGSITKEEAVAQKLALCSRIEKLDAEPGFSTSRINAWAAAGVAGMIALGSVGLYAFADRSFDTAGGPDAPLDAVAQLQSLNQPGKPALSRATLRALGSPEVDAPAADTGSGRRQAGSVDEMVEKLAQRLRSNPTDAEGWRTLGWSYLNLGRFSDATAAYRKLLELAPNSASVKASLAESLVRGAQDNVSAEAARLFESALASDPNEPSARYYLGLAKVQSGKPAAAIEDWLALLKDTDPAEQSFEQIRENIVELAGKSGIDVSQKLAALPSASDAKAGSGSQSVAEAVNKNEERGPNDEQVRASASMDPTDRTAMIRGMVDKLSARLETSPDDAEGWIKLMRSWTVLGDAEKAKAALEKAKRSFDGKPEALEQFAAAAKELGIQP